ncbi:MAG: cyclic pyranopterin monophosphate synthase MoaC [Marinicaulis sp.]|nr:cyclic pyranopterin monophosphate synthase MoaC [Marinicaulis sp.]
MADDLTHFDEGGRPRMVDVTDKVETERRAVARGRVILSPAVFKTVRETGVAKGDIATIAEIAGVTGAKRTSDLIPLCHPLPITSIKVAVEPDDDNSAYVVTAIVKTTGKTGVEMEALTGVMTACLTIYDMAKAVDKSIRIDDVKLIEKTGGKSGEYRAKE